jgi:hypothetical protein
MASILPPVVLFPSLTILISPSRGYFVSVLAADDTLYALWSQGAKIQRLHHDSQELQEMVNESWKFPLWLKDKAGSFPCPKSRY